MKEVVQSQSCSLKRADKKKRQRREKQKEGGGRRREDNLTITKSQIVTATNLVAVYNETQDTQQQDNDKKHISRREKWKMGIQLDGTCRA